jgi:asparagine synthase (glutamine-hydrolysing)
MNEFLTKLDKIVAEMCEPDMAMILSGGVDSALVATLAHKHCDRFTAYTVTVGESPDLPYAKMVAEQEGFEHKIIEVDQDMIDSELENMLHTIKKLQGDVSPVRVGAEFPTYFVAQAAAKDAYSTAFSAQGPDEMFGGYARYMPVAKEGGYPAIEKLLRDDTIELRDDIIAIDKAVCALSGVELREPMLEPDFIDYGLSIPVKERFYFSKEKPNFPYEMYGDYFVGRKVCIKKAAEEVLPKELCWRPKKAAQYGSGVHKALDKLARRYGYKKKARDKGSKQYLTMFLEERLAAI